MQIIREHCEQGNVPITQFVRFGEYLVQDSASMRVVPVKLTQELENFVDSAFVEDVVHKVSNEEFDVGTLFLLAGCTFWRIRLNDDE